MRLLSVDPSVRSVGIAVFEPVVTPGRPRGFDVEIRLSWSEHVQEEKTDEDMGKRCLRMAGSILRTCARRNTEPTELVFEWPKILTIGKSKGDPNDLIPMAGVGCALAGLLAGRLVDLFTPWPSDWIGNIPKQCHACKQTPGKKSCKVCHGSAWRTPRGRLIKESLSAEELALVHDQHDEIDSVGLGLWKTKRLIVRRVFPGAV
jgi:hypothetical protein